MVGIGGGYREEVWCYLSTSFSNFLFLYYVSRLKGFYTRGDSAPPPVQKGLRPETNGIKYLQNKIQARNYFQYFKNFKRHLNLGDF